MTYLFDTNTCIKYLNRLNDLLVAAISVANDVTLVTNNAVVA